MSEGNQKNFAGHTRERKTNPQYEGTLCSLFYKCKRGGHCKKRCSSKNMKCYKAPKESYI